MAEPVNLHDFEPAKNRKTFFRLKNGQTLYIHRRIGARYPILFGRIFEETKAEYQDIPYRSDGRAIYHTPDYNIVSGPILDGK